MTTAKKLERNPHIKYLMLSIGQPNDRLLMELQRRTATIIQVKEFADAEIALETKKPDILVIQLYYNTTSVSRDITDICFKAQRLHIPIIVMATHTTEQDVATCIRMGVSDFILVPCETQILLSRIDYQMSKRQFIETENIDSSASKNSFSLVADCMKILAAIPDSHRAISECLKLMGSFVKSPRINIFTGSFTSNDATILASSDSTPPGGIKTTLDRYPEVREVLMKNLVVYVEDISSHDLTKDIKAKVTSINIESLLVIPIRYKTQNIATLNIRLSKKKEGFKDDLPTLMVVAGALAPFVAELRKL
jgi:DNA-binding NarL/FixJ family response regulator